jgi:hypothetical protein
MQIKSITEGLTRENFFTLMRHKYPLAMERFSKWIDEYKKRVNWDSYFCRVLSNKYHDIPIAMQFGIFIQYVQESGAGFVPIGMITAHIGDYPRDVPAFIEDFFETDEERLKTT